MTAYVADASVAIKWFISEMYTPEALRLLDGTHEVAAPDLIHAEIGNILWKKVRRKELTGAEGRGLLKDFQKMNLKIVPARLLLSTAYDLAIRYEQTVYDCLYLSLALAGSCQLVTADLRFYRAFAGGPLAQRMAWVEDEL